VHVSRDEESKQAAPGVSQLGGVVHAVHVLAVAFRTERSLHTARHWSREEAVVTFPVVKAATLEPIAGVGQATLLGPLRGVGLRLRQGMKVMVTRPAPMRWPWLLDWSMPVLNEPPPPAP